jgi:putative transposase
MVTDLCREHGITQATFYRWRSKYGGMEVSDAQELNRLLDKNRGLKQLVADLSLDNQILKHVLGKNVTEPAACREEVQRAQAEFAVSQRRACRTLGASRAPVRYRARCGNDQHKRGLLRELAQKRRRFCYRQLAVMLRRLGERMNVKRVYRLDREEQLHLRRKRHHKRLVGPRGALLPCSRPNQRRSLDFMTDTLGSRRKFWTLKVIDDFTRECRGSAGTTSSACWSGDGPEFTCKAVQD